MCKGIISERDCIRLTSVLLRLHDICLVLLILYVPVPVAARSKA